jgi:hypothetical protein
MARHFRYAYSYDILRGEVILRLQKQPEIHISPTGIWAWFKTGPNPWDERGVRVRSARALNPALYWRE